jgi:integrase
MIKLMFSRRHKSKVYRLDATVNGKRFRRFFLKKSEAEAVAYKIKHDTIAKRYGLPVLSARPLLTDLIEKRLETLEGQNEHQRATRVLNAMASLLPAGYCVDELTKADIQKYVDERRRAGLKGQSINRDLNIVNAMLMKVDVYYPELAQWRPPRMPKQKVMGGRRERVWSLNEITLILKELYAPKRDGEQIQAAVARYWAGKKVEFCLMNGVRHSEMTSIRPTDIDWQDRTINIKQKKTGKVKMIGPVGEPTMAILREFRKMRPGAFVFSQGGKINRRFYRILRSACERAGVPYGRNTPNGLVLHDARHTATTHLLESGISPKTVQEWMGWANSSYVLYYSHASRKSREKAGRALEKLIAKKSA